MEQIRYEELQKIEKEYGTPFYLLDADKFRRHLSSFVTAFKRRYSYVVLGYSFKTNYVPALCRIAQEENCYAEVVSEMELDLAAKIGYQNIIFNGPIKKQDVLLKAIRHRAVIQLDAPYEIDYICSYKKENPQMELKIGLRVNVRLTDEHGQSTVQCGLREGRFGFPYQILRDNINRLKEAGIKIVSLHGHTSSSDRAVRNYRIIAKYMLSVCEEFELNDLLYFDIGGGFFGAAPEGLDLTGKPTYDDYANEVLDSLLHNQWFNKIHPTIVIEPGASVVSNVFKYYTKVYELKHIGSKNFIVVDGTVFDVKPTMHKNNLPFTVVHGRAKGESAIFDVVGSTCMEKDIILHDVELENMNSGDYIEIRGVGAYTISLAPIFINYLAPILCKKNGNYQLVRRKQNIEDIITLYKI